MKNRNRRHVKMDVRKINKWDNAETSELIAALVTIVVALFLIKVSVTLIMVILMIPVLVLGSQPLLH